MEWATEANRVERLSIDVKIGAGKVFCLSVEASYLNSVCFPCCMESGSATPNHRAILEQLSFCINTFVEAREHFDLDALLSNCHVAPNNRNKRAYENFSLDYLGLATEYVLRQERLREKMESKNQSKLPSYVIFGFGAAALSYALNSDPIVAIASALLGGGALYLMYCAEKLRLPKILPVKDWGKRKAAWQLESYKGDYLCQKEGLIKETLAKFV